MVFEGFCYIDQVTGSSWGYVGVYWAILVHLMRNFDTRWIQDRPTWSQDGPKLPQDAQLGANMPSKSPKLPPSWTPQPTKNIEKQMVFEGFCYIEQLTT